MPRRKKIVAEDLSITWVKEVARTRHPRTLKYLTLVEELKKNPDKIALLASGLNEGSASSRVVSLRSAAKTLTGKFRFPLRRSIEDGTYSVYGVCEG